MTLEVLFAQQGQREAFLLWCVLGLIAGALLQLSVAVHRHSRAVGAAMDVVCCVGMALAAAWVLMRSGAGMRLYGLLGLAVGALLYSAGVGQAVRLLERHFAHRGDTSAVPPRDG